MFGRPHGTWDQFCSWLARLDLERAAEEFGIEGDQVVDASRAVTRSQRNPVLREASRGEGKVYPIAAHCQVIHGRAAPRMEAGTLLPLSRDYDSVDRNLVVIEGDGGVPFAILGWQAGQVIAAEMDAGDRFVARLAKAVSGLETTFEVAVTPLGG